MAGKGGGRFGGRWSACRRSASCRLVPPRGRWVGIAGGGGAAWLSRHANLEAGFAVGRRRTYADLALVDTMRWILEHEPRALEAFPALARLRAAIDDDPRVARFYASDRHYPPPDRAYVEMMKKAMGA